MAERTGRWHDMTEGKGRRCDRDALWYFKTRMTYPLFGPRFCGSRLKMHCAGSPPFLQLEHGSGEFGSLSQRICEQVLCK